MEIGRHRGMIANEHIKIVRNSYEKVKSFKYLGSLGRTGNVARMEEGRSAFKILTGKPRVGRG